MLKFINFDHSVETETQKGWENCLCKARFDFKKDLKVLNLKLLKPSVLN